MKKIQSGQTAAWFVMIVVAVGSVLAGCAPLLIAGGAAGGYAVAKDMDDGQLIDDQKK